MQSDNAAKNDGRETQEEQAMPAKTGLVCPKCGCSHLFDIDRPWTVTHNRPHFGFIKRKRVCRNCGWKVTTHERIVKDDF
jgi:uncharacterized protein (DUF983 family)